MSLTPDEAAKSLREAADTELRSWEALGYSKSSPFMLLLGVFWLVCYGANQFWPARSMYIWLTGMVCFAIAMSVVGQRMEKMVFDERSRLINRNLGIIFGFLTPVFVGASIFVMHGWTTGLGIGAFIPLAYATLYAGMGLWMGRRYVIAGSALFIATLIGYYFVKDFFGIWMALFGGGTMIAAGLWLLKP